MDKKTVLDRRREFTRQFYRGNHLFLILGILVMFLNAVLNLLTSWQMQQLVDLSTGSGNAFSFHVLMGTGGAIFGGLILAEFMHYHASPRFLSRAVGQYQEYAFRQISRKSIAAFHRENTSVYISALTNDVASIETGYLANIFNLFYQVVIFVGALTMMFLYSVPLTLVSLAFSGFPMLGSLLAGNRVAEREKVVSEKNQSFTATLKDGLTGFSVVKAFRAEGEMCRLIAHSIREATDAKCMRRKMTALVGAFGAFGQFVAQFGVFSVGTWMALTGKGISPGEVMVFVQLMNFVVMPIGQVPQYLAERKAAAALIDKLAAALDENIREKGEDIPAKLESGIEVENLAFGYGETPILQNLSFRFDAGKSYAVVGVSGSGKSTLLNLLMAAHETYGGSIRYDGAELRQVSTASLYEMVSMVQQNVFMFNASIRDNITMCREFPKEEVDRAIALSGLTALIEEKGEDSLCGENGSGLSGGEKQRISIARSLLRRSPVLLVDEATAALDAKTAFQVSSAILNLTGLTRVVVTHDLDADLLKRYDGILTLKNGSVVETGTFSELMERRGYFYSLYTVSQ